MVFLVFLFSILTRADFEVGDFTYHELSSDNDTAKTVQVVKCSQKEILSITIPNSVTYNSITYSVISIAADSFSSTGATQFNSIYFPNTLQEIEKNTFKSFINLQNVGHINDNNEKVENTLPPKLLVLNDYIFDNTSIVNINVNNAVTLYSAFSNCQNLSHVVLPQTKFELINTFKKCTSLTTVENFEYCTKISGGFSGCSKLATLKYAQNLNEIGDYSFSECQSLTSFEFNDAVTELGDYSFYKCKELLSVDLKNIKIVGPSAFKQCTKLKSVTMNKVERLSQFSLSYLQSLTTIELPTTLKEIESFCFTGSSLINITGNPTGITQIESSFAGCKDMISVPVFESVEVISSQAFKECYQLKRFESGDKLQSIWSNAFDNCRGLEEFVTKSTNISLSGEAFINCMSLKSFNFDNVYELMNNAFEGCTSLTEVDFSRSPIIELPWQLFCDCGSFTTVILPPGITEFSILVFEGCSIDSLTFTNTGENTLDLTNSFTEFDVELKEVIFNSKCKVKLESTFANCQNLSRVVLPQTPFELINTFKSCTNLSSVENLQYCTKIGENSFSGCNSLVRVELSQKLTEIGNCSFFGCGKLQSVSFGNGFGDSIQIGSSAFTSCHSLLSFDFSQWHNISIGESAFSDCPLSNQTEIVFGYSDASNTITISSHAFSSKAINTIVFASPIASLNLDSTSFTDCSEVVCVVVDSKFENSAKVAFDEKVINGDQCPEVPPSSKSKHTALIVGCSIGAVALIVIIIIVVVVVKKKKQSQQVDEMKIPIFTTINK